jgi:hypothetical protein
MTLDPTMEVGLVMTLQTMVTTAPGRDRQKESQASLRGLMIMEAHGEVARQERVEKAERVVEDGETMGAHGGAASQERVVDGAQVEKVERVVEETLAGEDGVSSGVS